MPKIQMRRDTAANWKSVNPILLAGEWALETDTRLMKIGNGTTAYNALPYSTAEDSEEWQKPADWIDIRSGALDNSVYCLVAHSVPVENNGTYTVNSYPVWQIKAQVTTSTNTFDVFVDGLRIGSFASDSIQTLDWGALYTNGTVRTVYHVTTPSALVAHVVRITPTVNTDSLELIQFSNTDDSVSHMGTLWAHFETDNFMNTAFLFGSNSSRTHDMCQAITARNDELKIKITNNINTSGLAYLSRGISSAFVKLPTLVGNNPNVIANGYELARNLSGVKKLKLKQIQIVLAYLGGNTLGYEEIETDIPLILETGTTQDVNFNRARLLKKFPVGKFANIRDSFVAKELASLEPTMLDLTSFTAINKLDLSGTSSYRSDGIKMVTVPDVAPFGGSSPQINVSNTGIDRNALVQLFKSMPTVSAGQVCNITGATGATDLTAEDLAIATSRGWTITR